MYANEANPQTVRHSRFNNEGRKGTSVLRLISLLMRHIRVMRPCLLELYPAAFRLWPTRFTACHPRSCTVENREGGHRPAAGIGVAGALSLCCAAPVLIAAGARGADLPVIGL